VLFNMVISELEIRQKKLKDLIQRKAFIRRLPHEKPFKLASGGTSRTFFDCKQVTQDPEGIALVAEIIFEKVKNYQLDGIGGIETGAIPICTAVSLLSFLRGGPIPAFWVRHFPKKHGTMNKIEGGLRPNSRVVILDDVTTEGTSVAEAVETVSKMNCKIVEIITMVDRERGARKRFENAGFKFTSLYTISDFTS
jgi:orotate phosphoribosyltransferase